MSNPGSELARPGRILAYARTLPEGTPLRANDLLEFGRYDVVTQALVQLTKSKEILRVQRGVYVATLGPDQPGRLPDIEMTVAALARFNGETVAVHGSLCAYRLGLTSQQPNPHTYATNGHSHSAQIGPIKVRFWKAPDWQFLFGDELAGQIVRALGWLGPEQTWQLGSQIRHLITPIEREAIASQADKLPTWLTRSVES